MADRGRGRARGRGRGMDRGGGPSTSTVTASASANRGGRGFPQRGAARGDLAATRGQSSFRGTQGVPQSDNRRGAHRGRGAIHPAPSVPSSGVAIADSVDTLGERRPGFATLGTPVKILVNCFDAEVPIGPIYHYDIEIISNSNKNKLPLRATSEIIRKLQEQNPAIFTKLGSFDGRKNLYSPIEYPLEGRDQFDVVIPGQQRPWRVHIKPAAKINPASASRYIEGKMSLDNDALTTLNACNVAIRMQPMRNHVFNARSIFSNAGSQYIGRGVELWRGYFQSIRPVIGKMIVNVDISSAAFYRSGPLIPLCLDFLGRAPEANPVQFLSGNNLAARDRGNLAKLLRNLRVRTTYGNEVRIRAIRALSADGANIRTFPNNNGQATLISDYFIQTYNLHLRHPSVVCVQLSEIAWIPLELCVVEPGQFYRNTLDPRQTESMVNFSALVPQQRLQSIRNGLRALQYDSSTYLRDFGIKVAEEPLSIDGRILPTPTLIYGKSATVQPRNGQWNMLGKSLYRPEKILGCAILVYDRRFQKDTENHMKRMFVEVTKMLGMEGMPSDPPVLRKPGTGTMYWNHLKEAAMQWRAEKGNMPNLIIVVLPDMAEDIYTRIKNAGDIKIGVATQCVRGSKCGPGKYSHQYFVNVCLKINAKLGGINVIPKPELVRFISDRAIPTLVMGADVQHPGPGVNDRPSFAAVVGNVDSDASKYIATSRPQETRVELIPELTEMVSYVIHRFMAYRKEREGNLSPAPRRILFYRDGVSEGEFRKCREQEVDAIFQACDNIGIPRPKLTFVVVGKNHHIRFFPTKDVPTDTKTGNITAGLVVDRDITSPVEYDFYLQSHGGLIGTSRSAHYNVLLDQNNLLPDDLQRISFALCHVYARSTRSVSIVPPVYYADTVCRRAKHHYDPDGAYANLSESGTQVSTAAGENIVDSMRRAFEPIHPNAAKNMYFQ